MTTPGLPGMAPSLGRSMFGMTCFMGVEKEAYWQVTCLRSDAAWLQKRSEDAPAWEKRPLAFYEVHLSSWTSEVAADGTRWSLAPALNTNSQCSGVPLRFRTAGLGTESLLHHWQPIARSLASIAWSSCLCHSIPVMAHGGMFAVDSRLGTPDDFKYLVNTLHEQSIAVFVDFVGAHFAKDD
eukprot:643522-Amphidinium_carterae.1